MARVPSGPKLLLFSLCNMVARRAGQRAERGSAHGVRAAGAHEPHDGNARVVPDCLGKRNGAGGANAVAIQSGGGGGDREGNKRVGAGG